MTYNEDALMARWERRWLTPPEPEDQDEEEEESDE